ncbi:MAG: hypothetical protein QM754_20800 [Tepidisphaeraceae bacterium]
MSRSIYEPFSTFSERRDLREIAWPIDGAAAPEGLVRGRGADALPSFDLLGGRWAKSRMTSDMGGLLGLDAEGGGRHAPTGTDRRGNSSL